MEQKHPLLGVISITVEEAPDEVVRDVFACYCSLRVLANAAAKAGNFEVESKIAKGTRVYFAPLDVHLNYADHASRATLRRQGGQWEMLLWLREKDVFTRGLMINVMRSGYPQGEALTFALAKAEITWASGRTGDGVKRERSPDARGAVCKEAEE